MAENAAATTRTHEADVVIVGAGAAGATAALEAHSAGVSFVALDQLPAFGGTAITSGGGCCIAGSAFQRSQDIQDSPELALRDLRTAGQDEVDEEWARFYFAHSAPELYDWLVGHEVEFIGLKQQEFNSVPRWHQPRSGGHGLMLQLWKALEARGLADCWHFAITAEDLLWEDGRVVGVLARDAAGDAVEFRGRAVIMATGGFMGNRDMVLEHGPHLRDLELVLAGGGVGAQGLGHRLLARHGAVLTHMHNLFCYMFATPDYRDPARQRGLVIRRIEDNIWVTREGRRFHDESRSGAGTATPALLAQPSPTCFSIVDQAIVDRIEVTDPYYQRGHERLAEKVEELLANSPYITRGDTPEELGRRAGIDPAGLAQTLREWNALLASGATVDPVTGRKLAGVAPLARPPYYAVQFFPLARKNLGGVRTDLQCRVLTAAGAPIPGLFAAGELCGLAGGHLAGKCALEGMMMGASLFSGRVAGAWAAHAAGRPEPAHLDARRPLQAAARP
jgi:succinate dehydrogenase/fumarate reductase flavoprotein subunit